MKHVAFTHLRDLGPLPTLVEEGASLSVLENVYASEGLPVATAYETNGFVPVRTAVSLIEKAASALGDDLFGARLGSQMAPADFGPWARYVVSAPTLGCMIRRSIRTLPFHITSASFDLKLEPPYAQWQTAIRDLPERHRHHIDHVVVPMLAALRLYLGSAWRPTRIDVSYPRPACWQALENTLGSELRFAQPTTAIVFPESLLDTRMRSAPPAKTIVTFGDLRRIVLSGPPRTLVEAVSACISLRLLDGQSDLEGTAQLLRLHPRTLQRQLDEQNTRYRDVLEKVRIARARALIEETSKSLTEIALTVGYSDASGFSRAFRRHAGVAPSQVRRTGN